MISGGSDREGDVQIIVNGIRSGDLDGVGPSLRARRGCAKSRIAAGKRRTKVVEASEDQARRKSGEASEKQR